MDQTNTGATTRAFFCTDKESEQQVKQEMFAKPGAPQREEMLTLQVKNTMLQLNGQNVRLAAKNGRSSKTPGLHLSATHGRETAGQFTAVTPTQEGTTPRPDPEREAEHQPVRRPLKLAPLELPEEVREAQRQKLKSTQQEAKPTSCKLDVVVKEPTCARKVKSCRRQRLVKVCPPASTETLPTSSRLTRSIPTEQNGDKHLEEVVCRGTPAPLCSKPTPPLLSLQVKARGDAEVACQNPNRHEVGGRRLRLRRAHNLQEDQCNSNMSTGGLSADKDKLAQGVHGKMQQGERASRIQMHAAGKCIKEPPAASGERVRKSHQEDCSRQFPRCTLDLSAGSGSSEHVLTGGKSNASKCKLKKKNPETKHNNAAPLELLQL
ncbi:hypothetical protein PBY51_005524 [Eleginops maclovinus]|uniref:Uncharacterized protein n=1 Tax=Eleginops maclovinus TaxID=56733 RepID=A0AAN7X397_ELEMC|nr:hypothetical protein PBY51_005524 [Eleginops maclovinus]